MILLTALGGIVLGTAFGFWLASSYPDASSVLVATRWLADFSTLMPEDITGVRKPTDQVPAGALTETAEVVGRTLKVPLAEGQPIREEVLFAAADYHPERELLRFAFLPRLWSAPNMDQLVSGEKQLYPPSPTIDEVQQRLEEYVFDATLFETAYQTLELDENGVLRGHIFEQNYRLGDKSFKTHSYFTPSRAGTSCAAMIIPGTGHNASTGIFRNDADTYYGNIVEIAAALCDTFVFVKPNEDFVAIHNGGNKLSYDFVVSYLINRGSSYAGHYIVNTLAITKYLKQHYERVFVIGLSQGAQATLWNTLQSEPTGAVVSSGFSVLRRKLNWGTLVGIMVPGLYEVYPLERVRGIMARSRTQFLFTYGRGEFGVNKIEAEENYSCQFLNGLDNVHCQIHDGGHVFPEATIRGFMLAHSEQAGQ